MIHHATQLICDVFDKRGVKYQVEELGHSSAVAAGYGIAAGPSVLIRFISSDEDADVAIRCFSIINNTPQEKELEMLRVLNKINNESRYVKFYMAEDGDINLEYDLCMETPDAAIGDLSFELFVRFCRALRENYHKIAQVIYEGGFKPKDEVNELLERLELLKKLKSLRDNPILINEDEEDSSADEESSPEPDIAGFLAGLRERHERLKAVSEMLDAAVKAAEDGAEDCDDSAPDFDLDEGWLSEFGNEDEAG